MIKSNKYNRLNFLNFLKAGLLGFRQTGYDLGIVGPKDKHIDVHELGFSRQLELDVCELDVVPRKLGRRVHLEDAICRIMESRGAEKMLCVCLFSGVFLWKLSLATVDQDLIDGELISSPRLQPLGDLQNLFIAGQRPKINSIDDLMAMESGHVSLSILESRVRSSDQSWRLPLHKTPFNKLAKNMDSKNPLSVSQEINTIRDARKGKAEAFGLLESVHWPLLQKLISKQLSKDSNRFTPERLRELAYDSIKLAIKECPPAYKFSGYLIRAFNKIVTEAKIAERKMAA